MSSEKYWFYFHNPKNVLCSILRFVFWIFPPSDTAAQLDSADSKQNAISKFLFQDSFWHIFWAMRKMHLTFLKKATFNSQQILGTLLNINFFKNRQKSKKVAHCSKKQYKLVSIKWTKSFNENQISAVSFWWNGWP